MTQSQGPDQPVLSYEAGKIHAEGAFTSEIHIEARVSLQDIWNNQYHGSQIMGKRPGMYLKYLPVRYHEVNGDVLTGGSYLFRTFEEAQDYDNWTTNEFEVGEPKTTFWKQPLFKSVQHWAWKVIGAHNFTPVEEHAIGRFQRWSYSTMYAESLFHQLYPVMKDAAENRGAQSFWLLYNPKNKMVAVQLSFPKAEEDSYDSIQEVLESVAAETSVGDLFPEAFNTEILLDRTSPYMALWLPLTESPQGVHVVSPNLPHLSKATEGN